MKNIARRRTLNLSARIGLFLSILILGTMVALVVGETRGLALADLSDASVQAMTVAAPRPVLYAALQGGSQPSGIYRSGDNGQTWGMVSSWSNMPINTLATAPGNNTVLYAGTAGGPLGKTNNVWRSENGGQTWSNFNIALPANPAGIVPAVTAIATDPQQPQILYVGTDGQGVYRFTIGQIGFELVGGISLADSHVKSLIVGPNSRLYAVTNGGLFATAGRSWHKLETVPELPLSLAVAPSDGRVLYAGGSSGGMYRSRDGGQTWQPVNEGLGLLPGAALRITALAVDQHNSQHVVAATAYGLGSQLAPGGIYESRNGGAGWTRIVELDSLVERLTINQAVIHAASATGLQRYGQINEAVPTKKRLPPVQTLSRPTGIQALIMILTIGSAGLVLLGRLEWFVRRIWLSA